MLEIYDPYVKHAFLRNMVPTNNLSSDLPFIV